MSRPSLPPVQRRTRTLGVRLSDHEWDTLVARAAAAGQRPTAYVRDGGARQRRGPRGWRRRSPASRNAASSAVLGTI